MAVNEAVLALASSVGLVIDRTVVPELVLGQVCLISKGRVVACASSVFNYVEAPWALVVKFPHPDLVYAAKTINLHPEFNKREARTRYLSQTGLASELPASFENDIANISLEPVLPELQPDMIAQLNSLLSIASLATPQDLMGPVTGPDIISIIQRACGSGREGLLTFTDERNRPFARLAIRRGVEGYVQKAIFKTLTGELALFELIYRKPRGTFVFQQNSSFSWPNVRDIETPIEKICAEASKRADELPPYLEKLGGPQGRFIRTVPQFDVNQVHPNARWIVERLWTAFDGFLPTDRLWERVGADTYTTLRAIQEMLRLQLISLERGSPFQCSGQLGQPLAPLQIQELVPGEQLGGFYLDPLTGRPVTMQGAYQGKSPSNANLLLHNIQFPPGLSGCVVVRNNMLVGLTSGPYNPPAEQAVPQARLYQMTSAQALFDSSKKLRKTGAFDLDDLQPSSAQQENANMSRAEQPAEQQKSTAGRIGRFICPACRALNLESGNCQNCGADLETGMMPAPSTGEKSLRSLQKPLALSRHQIMVGSGVLVLGAAIMMMLSGGPKHEPPPAPPPGQTKPADDKMAGLNDVQKAIMVAGKYACFKDTPPDEYKYLDASKETNGALSFILSSPTRNQHVLFVVLDSTAAVDDLSLVCVKVPYTDYQPNGDYRRLEKPPLIEKGTSEWGALKFNYVVGRYPKDADTFERALVGAYRSPEPGKAILVIAHSDKGENFDYNTTLWLIQTMAADYIAKHPNPDAEQSGSQDTKAGTSEENKAKTTEGADKQGEQKEATPEEISDYVKKVEEMLKTKYTPSKSKAKASMIVGVSEDGSLNKLDLTNPSDEDDFNQTLQKLVQSAKYPPAPHTKDGSIALKVTISGGKLSVEKE
jgi:hypothetical protein